jgi:hypothetical protein
MSERCRQPTGNHLARILIARGWTVSSGACPRGYEKGWDFRRVGNTLVPLNAKAAVMFKGYAAPLA